MRSCVAGYTYSLIFFVCTCGFFLCYFSRIMSVSCSVKEIDFLQEGWRLEHENPLDRSSPMMLKGVVFNEMKGALSDIDRLFCTRYFGTLLNKGAYWPIRSFSLSLSLPLFLPFLNTFPLIHELLV